MNKNLKEGMFDLLWMIAFAFICSWLITTAIKPIYTYDWWRLGCLVVGLRLGYNALIRG